MAHRRADYPAILSPPPIDILGYGPISGDLDAGRLGLHWGRATAFADPPDKLAKEVLRVMHIKQEL